MKLLTKSILILGILLLVSCSEKEIYTDPEGEVLVFYIKRPLLAPKLQLRNSAGKILVSEVVGKGVKSEHVEVHMTPKGLVVLPGDSDLLWENTLWLND